MGTFAADMGTLYVVPTPVGNMEDITMRAVRILGQADIVIAEDTRTTGLLLKRLGITARRLAPYHKFNEHGTVAGFVGMLENGADIALVSDAGTPGISDPGFLIVREAAARGVQVQCLPGPTAFVPALVSSGLPCDRFCFEGFLPQKKGRASRIAELAAERRTIVIYESPHRLAKALGQLAEAFGAGRSACVCREISKLHEECRRGTLAELEAHYTEVPPKGEIVVVVEGAR